MQELHRIGLCSLGAADADTTASLSSLLRKTGGVEVLSLKPAEAVSTGIPVFAVLDPGGNKEENSFLRLRKPGSRTVLVSAATAPLPLELHLDLLRAGALEILDLAVPHLERRIAGIRVMLDRWRRIDDILLSEAVTRKLAGKSPTWLKALRGLIEGALLSSQPILITGETGTGKEAAATLVHTLRNPQGPLVVVDCGSIVETLAGSELFGHRRGAFTGAENDREGAVGTAHGGTLFLDECGELKSGLQAEFLRTFQEGTYKRVGEDVYRRSRFQLVAATNRNLEDLVRSGVFRSDLYYRMSAIRVELPPLRERDGDVPLLCRHFLEDFLGPSGPFEVDPALVGFLSAFPFKGNVRQLRSVVEAIAANYDGSGLVRAAHIPGHILGRNGASPSGREIPALQATLEKAVQAGETFDRLVEAVKDGICNAAVKLEGSAERAAARLGVSRRLVEKRRRTKEEPKFVM